MKRLVLSILLVTSITCLALFSQTTPPDYCYNEPITFLQMFDAGRQSQFAWFSKIYVQNSSGTDIYTVFLDDGNAADNPLNISKTDPSLSLSLQQMLSKSSITINDGTVYKIWVQITGNPGAGTTWVVAAVNSYTFRVPDAGVITANPSNVCYNGSSNITESRSASNFPDDNMTYTWVNSDGTTYSSSNTASLSISNITTTLTIKRKITSTNCPDFYSNAVTITPYSQFSPGSISKDQTICNGNPPSTLTGTSPTGGSGNYSYAWQGSSGIGGWQIKTGITTSSYSPGSLTSTTLYQRIDYDNVCNTTGSNTNTVAITVDDPVDPGVISTPGVACYNTVPDPLTLSRAPSGGSENFSYQWQKYGSGVYSNITGATHNTYTPPALTTNTKYQLVVNDATCGAKTTDAVTVQVYAPFSPGVIGSDQTVAYNSAPALGLGGTDPTGGNTMDGTSGVYTYQWQYSTDNATWQNCLGSGTTQSGYSITTPLTATTYYRRAATSNTCGTVYSNSVRILVSGPLTEGTISNPQTICFNTKPSTLTVTTPSGGSGNYTYQWQSCSDNYSFQNIPGATSSSYAPGALSTTTYYRRVLSDGLSGSVNTSSVKITVDGQLTEGTISANQSIPYNTAPTTLTCTAPGGGDGTYSYQWQSSTDNVNFSDISGATQTTYTPGKLNATTYFRRSASSGSCGIAYSSPVTITVYGMFLPGAIGNDQTICYNTSPAQLIGSSPSGGDGSYTYQWQSSWDNANFFDLIGITASSYTPGALTQTTYYRREVTSGASGTVYSNSVKITVNNSLSEGTLTAPQTICYGSSPNILTCSAPSGGDGFYSYQWQSSTDDYSWQDVHGATGSSYTADVLFTTTYFRRVVTSGSCGTAYSNSVKITVDGQLKEGSISPDQTVCYNSAPTRISLTAASGGTGAYTYGWQWSTDDFSWTTIVGATGDTYTPPALTQTTWYRRFIVSGTCGTAYSDPIQITVLPQVNPGVALYDQTKCYNSSPDAITVTAPSGGNGPGSYTYQWQKSTNHTTWSLLPGAITNSYQPPALTQTTYYDLVVTSGLCGSATTNTVTVTINAPLTEGTLSSAQTICYGATPNTLTVTAPSGGIPSEYTYQWQYSTDNMTWSNIPGAVGLTYTPGALTVNTYYRRSLATTSCGTVYTNSIKITINGQLTEGTISPDQTICYNSIPSIIAASSPVGGNGVYTYGWQSSTDDYTWNTIAGATDATYTPGPLTQTTYFRRSASSGECGTVYTKSMTVNVWSPVQPGKIFNNQTICYNSVPNNLTALSPTGGIGSYTFQWQNSTDHSTFLDVPSGADRQYTPPALTQTTWYRLMVTSGTCGSAYSDTIEVTVPGPLANGTVSKDQSICFNSAPDALTCSAAQGGTGNFVYTWQSSTDNLTWVDIAGSQGSSYAPGILKTDTFFRSVVSSGTCGTAYSNSVKINVGHPVSAGTISSSQQICFDDSPSVFSGTTADGGNGTYTYQWQNSTDSVVFESIKDAVSTTYAPGPLTSGSYYRRIVTSGSCGSDTSNIISIKVLPKLNPGEITDNQALCNGAIPAELSGSMPTGGDATYTYQWQRSSDNTLFVNVDSATNSSYAPPAVTSNIYYRRIVSSASCSATPGNSVFISVLPAIDPGVITQTQSVCYNSQPLSLTGDAASGGMGDYSYQWYNSANDTLWSVIPGETSLTYVPRVLTKSTYYKRVTTSGTCGSIASNIITIHVYDPLNAGMVNGSQSICYNTAADAFTDSISPSGGSGNYTNKWQYSTNKNTWNDIPGSNAKGYLAGVLQHSEYFRRVTTETCGTMSSNILSVQVLPALSGGQITGSQSICYNMKPVTLYGSSAIGADGNYTYQWQSSADSLTWTNLFFAGSSLDYAPDSLQMTTYYRRIATSVTCMLDSPSNVITVKVSSLPTPGSIEGNQTICYNGKPAMISGTPATGGTGNYVYSWQSSTDGTTWNRIYFFGDSLNYTPGNLTDTTAFRRKVSMTGCNDIFTNSVIVTVNPRVADPIVNLDSTYCYNSLVNLTESSGSNNMFLWYNDSNKLVNQGRTYTIDTFREDTKLYVQAVRESDNCRGDSMPLFLKLDKVHASFSTDITQLWEGNAVNFNNESFGAKSYIWNFYDGDPSFETNPWHFYNEPGTFDVQLIATSPDNCSDTIFKPKLITVTGNEAMGVSKATSAALMIFPNPATDYITVQGKGMNIQQIIICDMQGKQLIKKDIIGIDNLKVNVGYLPDGIYMANIKTPDKWYTFKFVKQ